MSSNDKFKKDILTPASREKILQKTEIRKKLLGLRFIKKKETEACIEKIYYPIIFEINMCLLYSNFFLNLSNICVFF